MLNLMSVYLRVKNKQRCSNLKLGIQMLLYSLLFSSSAAFSNVDNDLHSFFQGLGYESNVTSPRAFQDQAAGYYSGGSLFLRNQVKNYQMTSLELPSFSGGCSGIDAFLGSFSVINADEMIQMMKNIMSAGGAYAFDLALTTTVPQMESVKKSLQNYIDAINNSNINTCNTAEDLVGGVWPKLQSTQQEICRDVGSHTGVFSDYAAARQGCGTGGQFDQGIGAGGDREAEVVVNKNLVWDALQHNGFSESDKEVSETLMSLSGSIIITEDDDGTVHKTTLMSMADSQGLIKALLSGGQAEIYTCDEEALCLNPVLSEITISEDHALVSEVTTMIETLNVEVATDSGVLSSATRGFLEMTPIPILKYITTSLSLGKSVNPSQFSEVIAISLLNQYLSENIQIVQTALSQEDTLMTPLMMTRLTEAQRLISEKIAESYRKLSNINVMVDAMRTDEQQLTSKIASEAAVGQETR